ncbi:MAG: formate dehydrogenase accessory sulfurtransferase FdhD [Verrucomicrobiota bacterium]
MSSDQTAAALLVGGKSSRMGEDKSLLICEAGEKALYLTQLAKLRQLTPLPLLISIRSGQQLADLPDGVERVCDQVAEQGPLSALASCLEHSQARFLLVLAVDLPQISPAYLHHLIKQAEQSGQGVVPRSGRYWEPLAAVYPRSLLPKIKTHLAAGQLSLQKFIQQCVDEELLIERKITDSEKPLFSNLNTQQDLQDLKYGEVLSFDIEQWKASTATTTPAEFSPSTQPDLVAVEEPVELRIEGKSIAVLMRTPGHDRELAAGFLLSENVIRHVDDLFEISQCQNTQSDDNPQGHVLDVLLKKGNCAELDQLSRHVFTSSSCGVCGKTSIDSVFQSFPPLAQDNMQVTVQDLLSLPTQLKQQQKNFHQTGGLHASALFSSDGQLQVIREDVGRHNALDKIIGHALLEQSTPLENTILLLSGRISFELMQKALAAGIPFVVGLSAPSSLAVKFARQSGQTLIGFLRDQSFNLYAGEQRMVK